MNKVWRNALLSLTTAAACHAWAGVTVRDAWVRSTVPQQTVSGAFMKITSDRSTRLIEVRSPAAKTVQIHEMTMAGDVMRMRAIKGLELPAGKTIDLMPGSYHIMLMDLTAQIKAGEPVPLTLVFEDADKKRETVEVKAIARSAMSVGRGMQDMRDMPSMPNHMGDQLPSHTK